ncbi:MAG TPA: alpha/beta fold hydrolase [Gammaproteobacteria bacterium]|nr:alpha/beta fold hydrolase [Gammaproteobacteria bacterium]
MNTTHGFGLACLLAVTPLASDAEPTTSPCRLTAAWLPGIAADCTLLRVPENRAEPSGRGIDLRVARVPSLSPEPREDPLLVIAGGPGQGSVDFYLSLRAAFEEIRRDRDIVLLDQRGTGASAPLRCRSADAAVLEEAAPSALPSLMRACLDELTGDPRFYTSSIAVRDLESVREALGIAEWNLYGVSYGTRVAQHYARRHPEHTRALILDGAAPSDVPLGPDVARHAQAALDRTLERCAADTGCAAAFPNLATRLESLLERLSANPATLTLDDPIDGRPETQRLTRDKLASGLRLLSYAPQTAALLPLLIDAADRGNLAPITAQTQMVATELDTALSLPMHNAVVCTEDVAFFPTNAAAGLDASYLGTALVDALLAACSVWPAGELDADLREPLVFDGPVLLLSGELDPITPPAYGERVLVGLADARHLIGRGQGHGLAGVGCVPRLMRAFLERLDAGGLDATCLERETASPFFLDFNGPAP